MRRNKSASSERTEKTFRPEIRAQRVDKPLNPVGPKTPPASRRRPKIGVGPMNKHIPPRPSVYTELPRDRAEKLATLRRGKLDEFTWAAMGGLAASLPRTASSIADVIAQKTFSLSLPQFTDFVVTIIFLTLCGVAALSRNRGTTSMQYLDQHFGPDPDARSPKPWFSRLRKKLKVLRKN